MHLRRHPTVALTFDDLPAAGGLPEGVTRAEILRRLADELRAGHLKGVYGFVNAVDLDGDPDTEDALRVWIGAGMNIGNHTWSHPSLNDIAAPAFEREIAVDEPALREYAAGRDWHWFRYPNLEEGNTLAKRDRVRGWLHDHGYRIAEVTLTSQDDDWSDPYNRCLAKGDAAGIAWLRQSYLETATEFLRLGRQEEEIAFGHEIPNVLLLHATDFTTLMLPDLLHLLRQEGFHFAPLARVERNRAYALDPHAGLAEGGPFPNLFMNSRHLKYPAFEAEPVSELDAVCR
jgi:peptidoglycan/xylan/chitin deacetylase (PgdA/CDA1 family)